MVWGYHIQVGNRFRGSSLPESMLLDLQVKKRRATRTDLLDSLINDEGVHTKKRTSGVLGCWNLPFMTGFHSYDIFPDLPVHNIEMVDTVAQDDLCPFMY